MKGQEVPGSLNMNRWSALDVKQRAGGGDKPRQRIALIRAVLQNEVSSWQAGGGRMRGLRMSCMPIEERMRARAQLCCKLRLHVLQVLQHGMLSVYALIHDHQPTVLAANKVALCSLPLQQS